MTSRFMELFLKRKNQHKTKLHNKITQDWFRLSGIILKLGVGEAGTGRGGGGGGGEAGGCSLERLNFMAAIDTFLAFPGVYFFIERILHWWSVHMKFMK